MEVEPGYNGPYIAVSGEVRFRNITQQQFDEIAGEYCASGTSTWRSSPDAPIKCRTLNFRYSSALHTLAKSLKSKFNIGARRLATQGCVGRPGSRGVIAG